MMHINRIQLVNFHNFVDETIEGGQNIFLMGDNKSGKTTILDGIHFALTAGGRGLELNAAARFGNKQEAARSLASIFLRLDGPTQKPRRGPTVSYAVIELRDPAGTTHCIGAGAFTASLTSEPDTWGFIAQNRTLDSLGLIVERLDADGKARRSPRDEAELAEHLSKSNVFGDKGRYRSALAKFLYHDREAYNRIADLVKNAKSYRSIVAKAASLDDLFVELLPSPESALFTELKPALTGIDSIRANLDQMDHELGLLRALVQTVDDARKESERIARLHFVRAERVRRDAEMALGKADERLASKRADEKMKAQALQDVRDCLKAAERELVALRASPEVHLIDREAELAELVEAVQHELGETVKQYDSAAVRLAGAKETETRLTAHARAKADELAANVRASASSALDELDHTHASATQRLIVVLDAASLEPPHFSEVLEPLHQEVEHAWEARREEATAAESRAASEAEAYETQVKHMRAEADDIINRGEALPPLPEYDRLLHSLKEACPRAQPLYRLFELAPDTPPELGGALEMLMGPRLLGTIVAPPEEREAAERIVTAHGHGVQIALAPPQRPTPIVNNLLAPQGPSDLIELARAHANAALEMLSILPAGADSDEHHRVLWHHGRLYDDGLLSQTAPRPAEFLGAEARRMAAERRAAALREQADETEAVARRLREAEYLHRDAKARAATILQGIRATTPSELRQVFAIAAQAAAARQTQEEELGRLEAALARHKDEAAKRKQNHDAVKEVIAKKNVEALADRMRVLETRQRELAPQRDQAHEQATLATQAHTAAQSALESAQLALREATEHVTIRADDLRPYVEPKYQQDLIDYAFRIKKGEQFASIEGISRDIQSASESRASLHTTIRHKSQDEVLWQKYAFVLHDETQEVRDQAGKLLEDVATEREQEVHDHQEALNEKTRDLFDRVLMDGLVKHLLLKIDHLEGTISNVNRLCSDLIFGTARFRFDLRVRQEYRKVLRTMRETNILDPAAREDIKDFFQARIDELNPQAGAGIPQLLDYRAWFHYVLQTKASDTDEWVDLTSENMGFGSTGEQAVPNHMLIIAVASLLYDDVNARLRILLLDEAFLGIDGSGRDILLRFADRCKVDLVVATPELDGLTPALAASTTLLIEKTADGDVFVRPFPWERAPSQTTLTVQDANEKAPEQNPP